MILEILAGTLGSLALIRLIVDLRQPKFKQIYGCKDKNIIVTGANSGIGYQTAKFLYKEGAIVIMACRNQTKTEEAIEKIKKQCKEDKKNDPTKFGDLIYMNLDLNSFRSIHEFAKAIEDKKLKIFSLVNNAGVFQSKFALNEYGFEEHFMVNHLGQQLLTDLLLPSLIEGGTEISPSKIVFVNSALYKKGTINELYFEEFKMTKEIYDKTSAYADAKLAELVYARELAEQCSQLPLYVNITTPGLVATNLFRNVDKKWLKLILAAPIVVPTFIFLLRTPKQGCQSILQCVLGTTKSSNGKFIEKCKETKFAAVANDFDLNKKVYQLTRKAIGITESSN